MGKIYKANKISLSNKQFHKGHFPTPDNFSVQMKKAIWLMYLTGVVKIENLKILEWNFFAIHYYNEPEKDEWHNDVILNFNSDRCH